MTVKLFELMGYFDYIALVGFLKLSRDPLGTACSDPLRLSISRRSMERTLDLTSLALMDVLSLSSSTSWRLGHSGRLTQAELDEPLSTWDWVCAFLDLASFCLFQCALLTRHLGVTFLQSVFTVEDSRRLRLPVWSLPSSFSQCTRGALCKNPLGVIFPCSRAERATECCSQFTTHTGHRYVRQNTV